MSADCSSPSHTRRDALRIGGAAGVALAAAGALRPGAAARTPAAEAGVSVAKRTVALAAAERMLAAAQAEAEGLGVAVAVAVVDEAGLLKAFHRMDGVGAVPVDIAQMKAYTGAIFRAPTHELAERNLDNPARLHSLPNVPRGTLLAGGYPVRDGEAVVGGVGVSGATPEQDMQIAEAALAALQA